MITIIWFWLIIMMIACMILGSSVSLVVFALCNISDRAERIAGYK